MSGARSRNRGAESERMVVAWLRTVGFPDARRYLAGDGRQPGDIDAIPGVCIEVKSQSNGTSWPSWVRQAVLEAGPDRVPVVVRRTPGSTDVARWVAVTPWPEIVPPPCHILNVEMTNPSLDAFLDAFENDKRSALDSAPCFLRLLKRGWMVGRFAAVLRALDAYPVEVER